MTIKDIKNLDFQVRMKDERGNDFVPIRITSLGLLVVKDYEGLMICLTDEMIRDWEISRLK